ncbi:MAG TPA: helix-turn-helix transcriptional regulator [Trichormus sp.]
MTTVKKSKRELTVHDQLVMALSVILRDRREALDISQSDLARRSGLHRSYIGDLERGSRNISVRNLSRLAVAMGLQPSRLLSLAEKKLVKDGPIKKKRKVAVATTRRTTTRRA